MSQPSQSYTLVLLGDLMIGRLVDALLPTSISRESPHTDPEAAARTVDNYVLKRSPELKSYTYSSPWGNSLSVLQQADLVLANLETALTTSERRWPNKAFNYRSHPANVRCLIEIGMGGGTRRGYVSLANNHTLDWEVEGLHETIRTLNEVGVEYAGAGRSKEEASKPAKLRLGVDNGWDVKCWSFADHPSDWGSIDCFNLIAYTKEGREKIKGQLMAGCQSRDRLGLKIVSVHWGPNYRWHPAAEIVDLAHWMVDECDVDIIHGHSSHHVQGVEIYKGKLIIYGCGDFVDDYAIDPNFRNDLSAAWRVTVGERAGGHQGRSGLEVQKLEIFPNRIQRFQAHLLERQDPDHEWLRVMFQDLCLVFSTKVEEALGDEGQIVVNVREQR